jgi:hypothetical protein
MEYINRQTMGVLFVEDGSVDVDDLCEEGLNGGKVIVYRAGTNAPKIDGNNLNTKPFVDSSENILKEMYALAKSFCER